MTPAAANAVLTADRDLAQRGVRFVAGLARLVSGLRELAPYAAIELLLPGGSLIALSLWLYRRYKRKATSIAQESVDATAQPAAVIA
jgi:hypothetical protein